MPTHTATPTGSLTPTTIPTELAPEALQSARYTGSMGIAVILPHMGVVKQTGDTLQGQGKYVETSAVC